MSQKQIAALWVSQGGNPAKADEASAVAMAESSGDTQAGNYCCHGLWAFNVEAGVASMTCALNPICATRKAVKMSKQGTDWGPWEAHTNGAYKQFLGKSGVGNGGSLMVDAPFHIEGVPNFLDPGHLWEEAEGAVDGIGSLFGGGGGSSLTGTAGNVSNAIQGMAAFFVGLGELILTPEGWLRLGKILGGSLFLVWGLRIVTKEITGTDPVGAAVKAGKTAAVVATVK